MRTGHIVGWCDDCHERTCPICDNCDCDGYPCKHQEKLRMPEWDAQAKQAEIRKEYLGAGLGQVNAEQASESRPYYVSLRLELERRRDKLQVELVMVNQALQHLTPEVEATLQVSKLLDQLRIPVR